MELGLAGAAITIAAIPFSSVRMTLGRTLMALGLLVLHVAACIAYYFYVQHNPADTAIYYFDPLHFDNTSFRFGTIFTIKLTQVLKRSFGGTYLECFIFFQSIGFWGVMLLMRSFDEVNIKMGVPKAAFSNCLLFLPSIHFWTVAIGKDAPLFFAVSLCTWAALRWKGRLIAFGLGLAIMVLFRAHIALIMVMALAAAAALHPGVSFGRKIGLFALTVAGAVVLAGSVQNTLKVNVLDANSIATFLTQRNDIAGRVGGNTTFGDAPLFVRFTSLLFRPLFFDATNLPAFIASIENVGSVLFFLYLVRNWRCIRFLARRVFFVEFSILFSFILIILLAIVDYNVGLGLRERVMAMPPLFCVFVALWVMPRRSARQSTGGPPARAPAQIPLSKPATELPL